MSAIAEAIVERGSAGDAADAVAELRAGIDQIDRTLVELLAERCRLARALGRAKGEAGAPLVDHPREAEVVRRAGAAARERGMEEEVVRRLYWSVIELSRRTQGTEG